MNNIYLLPNSCQHIILRAIKCLPNFGLPHCFYQNSQHYVHQSNDGWRMAHYRESNMVLASTTQLADTIYIFGITLILEAKSDKTPVINVLLFLKQIQQKTLHPSSIPRNPLCLSGFQGLNGTNPPFITLHRPSFPVTQIVFSSL